MKKKTFFDYQNDKDYAQDMATMEFVHLKTGERVRFGINIKKRRENNWKALSPSYDGYRKDISPSA